MEKNYIELNKAAWDSKVPAHLKSEFYDQAAFLAGKNSLKDIELELFGNVNGKTILHLQCHFGQDSLSLARMGASVTGLDFSEPAIEAAKQMAKDLKLDAEFICADVYRAGELLNKQYDMVFTSYGTIGWLPDLQPWAAVIAGALKPGGRFVFAEFHPFLWMYNDDFTELSYAYFNEQVIVETYTGSYANRETGIESKTVCWNHSLADVITALVQHNLQIESFREYDYAPYDCFQGMTEYEPGKFRIKNFKHNVPMVYSLVALKKS